MQFKGIYQNRKNLTFLKSDISEEARTICNDTGFKRKLLWKTLV